MGECHVHKGIRSETLNAAREQYPDAEVLVHPECGCAGQLIYEMGRGDIRPEGLHIASTEGMIRAVTRAAGQAVHRRHRDRHHAPHGADGAGEGVHRGGPRGRVRLHEDDHPRERAGLARARPLPHHRPSRHRGARPRRDRPHGRARASDARRERGSPPLALAEDGPTDVTTAVTVPPGLAGRRAASSSGAAACWPGAAYADAVARACELPGRLAVARRARGPAGAVGRHPYGGRSRASSAPSGRCSTCCSARRASPPRPGPTWTRSPGTRCRILHTRKTAPGLRALDIAAVLAGGGAQAPGRPEPRGDGEGQPLAGARRSGERWPRRSPRHGAAA